MAVRAKKDPPPKRRGEGTPSKTGAFGMLRRVKKSLSFFCAQWDGSAIVFLVLVLLTIGLVMLFSASYAYAYYNMKGDSYYFIRNQAIFCSGWGYYHGVGVVF